MESIRLKARAKINLGLDVIGRRENGYHDVRMVMQTVGLYDRIIMTRIPEEEIRIKTNIGFLPVNENNLVYKAIMLMKNKYNLDGGIEVDLNKFIPVAAGMAGGSSDAACALFGMNRLFELNVPMKELMKIGVEIGADVPYCLMRGTALAEGIGEKLTTLPDMPFCHILIAKPPVNVSTKLVSMFNETPFSLNVYSVLIMKLESPATIVVKLSLPTYSLSFSIIFLSV